MGQIFDHYTSSVILRRAGQDALGRLDELEARVARLERTLTLQRPGNFRGLMIYGNNGPVAVRPTGVDQMIELGSTNNSIKLAGGAGGRGRVNIYTGSP